MVFDFCALEAIGNKLCENLDGKIDPAQLLKYVDSNPEIQKIFEKIQRDPRNIIQKGYSIKTTGPKLNGTKCYYVNICSTRALEQSADHSNVSIILSDIRHQKKSLDESEDYNVIDGVFHKAIFEKASTDSAFLSQIIQLCLDCVKESHGIQLLDKRYTIIANSYMEPFGWDENGQPLKESSIQLSSVQNMTPTSLLAHLTQSDTDDAEITPTEVSLRFKNPDQDVSTKLSSNPLLRKISMAASNDEKDFCTTCNGDANTVVPIWEMATHRDKIGLRVLLPGVVRSLNLSKECASQMKIWFEQQAVHLRTMNSNPNYSLVKVIGNASGIEKMQFSKGRKEAMITFVQSTVVYEK